MRGLRSTLVLFAVLVGLGAYIYFVEMKKPAPGAFPERDKVFQVESDRIVSLRISPASAETSVLEKGEDGWSLVSPTSARAEDAEVSSVTSAISNLEIERVVDEEPGDLAQYGLEDPVVEVAFKLEGEEQERRLQLGKKTPTGGHMYAKLAGEKRVFLVSGYLDSTFDKEPFDLRDKSILVFDRDKAAAVEIAPRGGTRLELSKTGNEWRLVGPVEARADYGTVEGLVGRLHTAQMRSIVAEVAGAGDLKKYGLHQPQLTATVGLGSARATLELGEKTEEGTLYARDTSRSMVFTVDQSLADELRKPVDDYRRKDVFEFRTYNASRVEVTRGEETRAYEKSRGTEPDETDAWRQVQPAAAELEQSTLESFLTKLSNLRAESFVPAGDKAGSGEIAATVTVRFDDGQKEERVTFRRSGSDVFASRHDEPGFIKIEAERFEEALKAFDEIKLAEAK